VREETKMNAGKLSVNDVLSMIVDRIPHFDRVRIWFDRPLSERQLRRLSTLCMGGIKPYEGPMFLYNKIDKDTGGKTPIYSQKWIFNVELLQPTVKAFIYLEKVTKREYLANDVEVTYDLITESFDEAEQLQEWFEGHLIKRWHGTQECKKDDYGMYYAARKSPSNLIPYIRESKIAGM